MFLIKKNKKLDLELLHQLMKEDSQNDRKARDKIESAYYCGTRVKKNTMKEKYNLGENK